ncbi:hypothetical protein N5E02_00465 [Stenotrophomonas sp. GD03777]|uniref:hypothetical protein n=1 Tax=Stenotrophomonas TaxID=40323 RepID=UPI001311B285|nr:MULTISPECIES: hypothetical protein [Stenotrophomonas]MDH1659887.1 hypothetical protein [Stenotrophomonas sp. GD03777]
MERKFGAVHLVVISVLASAIGAVASWFAFGAPRGVDLVANNGNSADWVAAIGTWVIGFSAAYYAHQAHMQRNDEIRERRLAELERKDVYLSGAMLKGVGMGAMSESIKGFLDIPANERCVANLRSVMRGLETDACEMAFSDEVLSAFPSTTVLKISSLNSRILGLRRLMASANGYLTGSLMGRTPPAGDVKLTDAEDKLVREMLVLAEEIGGLYQEYTNALIDTKISMAMAVSALKGTVAEEG